MRTGFLRTSTWVAVLAMCVAGAVLLAACGGADTDDDAALASATVTSGPRTSSIAKNKFESPMRVAVGSKVTWVNDDGLSHNVVGGDGAFKSGTLDKGDTFTHEFTEAGLFKYTCTFHPGMNGVIQVE